MDYEDNDYRNALTEEEMYENIKNEHTANEQTAEVHEWPPIPMTPHIHAIKKQKLKGE